MDEAKPQEPRVHRVVYELNDERESKCRGVLRSMSNHIKGKGGPALAQLALMVHDEAHAYFIEATAAPDMVEQVNWMREQQVQFYMCGNTLKRFGVDPSQLLPGFIVKPEGAMIAITDLILDGYIYLRP